MGDRTLAPFAQESMGRLDADLNLLGLRLDLARALVAEVQNCTQPRRARERGARWITEGRCSRDRTAIDAGASNPQGLTSSLNLGHARQASARPFRIALARTRPMTGRFAAHGEIRPALGSPGRRARSLSGEVTMDGTIAGTLARPRPRPGRWSWPSFQVPGHRAWCCRRSASTPASTATLFSSTAPRPRRQGRHGLGTGRMDIARRRLHHHLDLKRFQLIQNEIAPRHRLGASDHGPAPATARPS